MNLQGAIIHVYQSYLTTKSFNLKKYLRINVLGSILWPLHSFQSLCCHDAKKKKKNALETRRSSLFVGFGYDPGEGKEGVERLDMI